GGGGGLSVATALVLCPSRDSAIPFYDRAADYVGAEETLELVGDVERASRQSVAEVSEAAPAGGERKSQEEPSASTHDKVPVTILTGFLGAGKTTMLNHLLHVQREKRIAVIENEFGEVPIDGDLLADGDGLSAAEQVVVLDNGCMCCTVRGDLLGAFASVLDKMEEARAKGEGDEGRRPLDSVLVETTGMADPVPIVRTLLQTPAISKSFTLDGVVTLVDAKNILPRLREGEEDGGESAEGGEEIDEAFQQIMFSDRIVVNKVDLVPAGTAVEVFQRIRSMNASAGVVSCSRGKIDPAELEGLGAFDRLMREAEQEPNIEEEIPEAHDHSHSHSHGHEDGQHEHDDTCGGGEDGGSCAHAAEEDCSLDHDHTGHSHDTRHSSQVGTFSLVKKSTEVLALPFARWVRSLAFLPKDKGVLFRSKAVLAVAGSDRKLVFHAVSDVMERREAGLWAVGEDRGCRIVFIGKRLDRAFLEEGFNSTARAVSPHRSSTLEAASLLLGSVRGGGSGGEASSHGTDGASLPSETPKTSAREEASLLEGLAGSVPGAFFLAMLGLGTADVLRVGEACSGLLAAVEGGHATEHYRILAGGKGMSTPAGFHLSLRRSSPRFYLHPLVSVPTARSYAKAAAAAKLEMTPSMGQGKTGISFKTADQLEAAGITWLEVEQLADPLAKNFVVEFTWRPETMATFFESPNSSTSSAMVKIEYEVEDEDAFDEEIDTLKFRLVLRPETDENNEASSELAPTAPAGDGAGAPSALPLHRLMIQTVGGRSCSQVYGLSFHSISPSFQVHVQVPDHRVPYFQQTDQLFHKWHPLMENLRAEPRLRFLVRMKPDGSGPLDNMCGCC
ncbi:unnamed protein product, partial [Scytosiphon promiscuus]